MKAFVATYNVFLLLVKSLSVFSAVVIDAVDAAVVCCCLLLSAVFCCCLLLSATVCRVCCCLLLFSVAVCCCLLLSAVVCCCLLLSAVVCYCLPCLLLFSVVCCCLIDELRITFNTDYTEEMTTNMAFVSTRLNSRFTTLVNKLTCQNL